MRTFGNYNEEIRECTCFAEEVATYRELLRQTVDACFAIEASIPIRNRDLAKKWGNEPSCTVRKRVEAAHLLQQQRNGVARFNSALSRPEAERCSSLDTLAQNILEAAQAHLSLSIEQGIFLLQVARTAADLACGYTTLPCVQANHVAEAICSLPRW